MEPYPNKLNLINKATVEAAAAAVLVEEHHEEVVDNLNPTRTVKVAALEVIEEVVIEEVVAGSAEEEAVTHQATHNLRTSMIRARIGQAKHSFLNNSSSHFRIRK